jgi:glycerol-3-phosphate acyltransferase PlsY
MFCVKGFAGGKGVARYFGFAAAVTGASNIAATIAAAKRGGSSVEQQTSVIGKVQRGDLINGIDSRPIGRGWQQFPLWIIVPKAKLPRAISSRWCLSHRSPPKMAANKHTQPE